MKSTAAMQVGLQRHLEDGKFRLPPFPAIAQRVTELAATPEASASAIAELIHRDPGLASEILRYANSAAIGARVEIVSVHQAIAHLGIQRVSEISLSASLRSGIFDAPSYAGLAKIQWRRSLATALVAKGMARSLRLNVEMAFLCGLLWNVGATLVLHGIPAVAGRGKLPDEDDADALAGELNIRFRDAAVRDWSLPEVVSRALGEPRAEDRAEASAESSIASLSDLIAPDIVAERAPDVALLAARPEAERLNLYADQLRELCDRAGEFRTELEAMP